MLVTLACESLVSVGFALWRKKPVARLLVSSVLVNGITQPCLWVWLAILYQEYIRSLLLAESLILLGEAVFLKQLCAPHLRWRDACLLSLAMNGMSFGIGLTLSI
ncbi:MAG: hypothetical protein DDG59_04735 [Anaerolineae bacterium]|nr:MAG: hypothetical protein DDG59_04735 [Anaerolineae bacterium]